MIIIIFRKTRQYFQEKARIDKAVNQKTAYKIQLYNDWQVDDLVKKSSEGEVNSKPAPSKIWADLSILNKPEVYKNYNKIINSKYTSNDNLDKLIIKNKANKDLNRIVEAEVERISKNLDYVEQVVQKYEVPFQMYEEFKAEQKKNSIANRQEILKKTAIKSNDLLVSDGLNINNHVFTYKNIEKTAEHLLRQSQMTSKHEEINAINQNYINQGKDKIYTGKEWIWTGAGETTRHRSNHLQKRQVNEPFIIVNDKTLHIDELMYPSDPAGSFSNSFICYCECQYLTGDDADLKQLGSLSLVDNKFKVNTGALKPTPTFMNAKQFKDNLNKPKPVNVAQPVGTNIQDYMNVNVGTPIPNIIDDNIEGISSIPHNYLIDGNKVDVVYSDGKYFYNGLELKEYDVQTKMGKVSKSAVTKHNNKLGEDLVDVVYGEYIDTSKLGYVPSKNNYLVKESDGVKLNEETGKYELNGLPLDYYSEDMGYGKVSKDKVDIHNDQFGSQVAPATPTADNTPKKEFISKDEVLMYDGDDGDYTIGNYLLDEIDGKYYYKGLDVTPYKQTGKSYVDVPPNVVEAHNNMVNSVASVNNVVTNEDNVPKKEFIDKDHVLMYDADDGGEYTIGSIHIEEINGKYYYRGLDVTPYKSAEHGYVDVPADVVEAHNNEVNNVAPVTSNADNTNIVKEEITDADLNKGYYSSLHNEYTIYNTMGVDEVNGKQYYKGLDITDYWDSNNQWADVPAHIIEEHNNQINGVIPNAEVIDVIGMEIKQNNLIINLEDTQQVNGKYYYKGLEVKPYGNNKAKVKMDKVNEHNAKVLQPNKQGIDVNGVFYDEGYEMYQFDKYTGLEYNDDTGKWEVDGLEVDKIEATESNSPYGYISGKKIKDHNDELGYDGGNIEIRINDTNITPQTESDFKPVVTVKDYVLPRSDGKISKAIKYGKDEDGQRYAVDKNGRQWVIDEGNHSKFEKLQDAIQKLIDFTTAEFNGVSNWGHSGYRPINKFLFQKDDYNKGFKHILDEVIPVLNKIRKEQAETGNVSQSLLNSFDNILNKVNDSKMVQTLTWIKDIDVAMAKAPPLPQDTLLGRTGAWDLNFNKVGEIFEWEGYSGTAYDPAGLDLGHGSVKYNITILAPKGTRGVYLSEDTFDSYGEREWLLPRGQKFRVLEFDEEAHTCTIELINEWD